MVWVFSPAHLRAPEETPPSPPPSWAPGIPAISGLRVYLALRLVRGWGRLRKNSRRASQPHPASLTLHPRGQMFMWSPAQGCDSGHTRNPDRITNAFLRPHFLLFGRSPLGTASRQGKQRRSGLCGQTQGVASLPG